MKIIFSFGLATLATAALAQPPGSTSSITADCTATNPCAVTTDLKTGRQTATHANVPAGMALPFFADPPSPVDGFERVSRGPDVLSLEETAVRFLMDVAEIDAAGSGKGKPFDPDNVSWDRGQLNDAEAAEVLALARSLNSSEKARVSKDDTRELQQMCGELNASGDPDVQLVALERAKARDVAREKALGKAWLDKLSPGARAHLLPGLIEHRKAITIGQPDWQKIRATAPEQLEVFRARACTN